MLWVKGWNLGSRAQITQPGSGRTGSVSPLYGLFLQGSCHFCVSWKSEWCSNELLFEFCAGWIWNQLLQVLVAPKKVWGFSLRASKAFLSHLSRSIVKKEGNGFSVFWIYCPRSAETQFWVPQFDENIGKVECVQGEAAEWKTAWRSPPWRMIRRTGLLNKVTKKVPKCLKETI